MAPDIEWVLMQGHQYGVGVKLAGKQDYLRRSCTGELSQQNDLFRLTYALEMAKNMCWASQLFSDREWSGRHAAVLNGIYLSRSSLDAAFDDGGQQVAPVMARLTVRVQGLETLLNRCEWQIAINGPSGLYGLTAEKYELKMGQ